VAIMLDSPLGPAEQRPQAVHDFVRDIRRLGLQPACYKLVPELTAAASSAGLSGVKFGEEAIVELNSISLQGSKWRDVREALRYLPRAGFSAEWYDLSADAKGWKAMLRGISDRWLARKFGSEIGFAMSRMSQAEKYADEQRLMVLVDAAAQPRAFITLVPMFCHGGGWALDLMRRDEDIHADGMRFLIASALLALKDEGCRAVSLGLAPLADISPDEWPGEQLASVRDLLFNHFNQIYNFKGLMRFKSRFNPVWEPRYLAFQQNSLPLVLLSLYRAHWT
jgi:phosphatidylglycerol lysyltransferase